MSQTLPLPQHLADQLPALRAGFSDFYEHGLVQLTSMDENNGMLRFATVSLQISLELFVKHELLVLGRLDLLFENAKKGKPAKAPKFRRFSEILSKFIDCTANESDRLDSTDELLAVLHARNAIVHSGGMSTWDPKLARQVITTALFIETSYAQETDRLISTRNRDVRQKLSRNRIWRQRTKEMAADLAADHAIDALFCPFCSNRALLPSDVFPTAAPDELNFSCATCLETLIRGHHGDLVRCPLCQHQALWIDTNNLQRGGWYAGLCLRCEQQMQVYQCSYCGQHVLELVPGTKICDACSDSGKSTAASANQSPVRTK
jgi:DNA-directed RNA polymerase subunit RPC12/RpoP